MSIDREPIVKIDFDSKRLPPDHRFDAWRRALVSFDLSRQEETPFDAVAQAWMLGSLIVTRAHVDPLRYDRSLERIADDANDHFALVYLISGEFVGDYGTGTIVSGPGSLTVLDMRRPYWTDATRLDAFVLSVARTLIVSEIGQIDPHGLITDSATAALLGAVLEQMAAKVDRLTWHHAPWLSRMLCDLINRTIIDGDLDSSRSARGSRNNSLVQRVQAYVDAHLALEVSASSIGQAIGVSRSALYRAFDDVGGVQQEIQRRRLRKLRVILADPDEKRSIAQIVRSLGFADPSHASRLFKREYCRTPGEYRRARVQHGDLLSEDLGADAPRIFDHWTRLLD